MIRDWLHGDRFLDESRGNFLPYIVKGFTNFVFLAARVIGSYLVFVSFGIPRRSRDARTSLRLSAAA